MAKKSIRLRASGVILHGDSILLVEYDDERLGHFKRRHFNIPGGGVRLGEKLRDAARREVREETALGVEAGRLLLTWEFHPDAEARQHREGHTVGFVFLCHIPDDAQPRLPDTPDAHQIAVRWIPLTELESVPLLPHIATQVIVALQAPNAGTTLVEDV